MQSYFFILRIIVIFLESKEKEEIAECRISLTVLMDHSEWMIVNVLNGIACIPTFSFFILLWRVIENLHVVFIGSGDDKPKHPSISSL